MVQGSLSLANKYRPKSFDDGMVGQKHIVDILKTKMQSDSTALQNYLFYGPRGTGKTTSARILAKAINCLNLQDGNPCNECANCKMIQEGTTLDYVEIDAASMTGVDNIREEVIAKMIYPPTQLKKKIYVIDEVHMLSKSAFNALLKTIEEPWSKVSFILATTEIDKVLDTIISRCQVFQFKKVPEPEIVSRLQYICEQEKIQYESSALEIIAMLSDGCVRDAIKYLDQVSVLGTIDQESVSKLLGISSETRIKQFLQMVKTGDLKIIFDEIDKLYQEGIDLGQFTQQSIRYLDRHFLDDVSFALSFSKVLFEIIRQIKYYPYQTILYKMEIASYFQKGEKSEDMPVITLTSREDSLKEVSWKKEEKKNENSEGETKIQNEPSDHQERSSIDLWKEVVTKIPEEINGLKITSKKESLLSHVSILEQKENQIKLVVTNVIAQNMLKDEMIFREIVNIFSEILGKSVEVSYEFMTKEQLSNSLFDF